MLTLHHARASVASAKVRLVLAEKGLDWHGEVLDLHQGDQHRPQYRAINPRAVVPTLVHDGRVVAESSVIMEYLEDAFPSPSLMPADPFQRAGARLCLRRTDDLHLSCATLTFALAFRRFLSQKPAAELQAMLDRIPDAAMREARRAAIEKGLTGPETQSALGAFDDYLVEIDDTLQRHAYLAGDAYSLADAAAAP
jgi:glutathione S-transferase